MTENKSRRSRAGLLHDRFLAAGGDGDANCRAHNGSGPRLESGPAPCLLNGESALCARLTGGLSRFFGWASKA